MDGFFGINSSGNFPSFNNLPDSGGSSGNMHTYEGLTGVALGVGGIALDVLGNNMIQDQLAKTSQFAWQQTQMQNQLINYNQSAQKADIAQSASNMASRQAVAEVGLGKAVNPNSGSLYAIANKNYVNALNQQNAVDMNANVQHIDNFLQAMQRQNEIRQSADAQNLKLGSDIFSNIAGMTSEAFLMAGK